MLQALSALLGAAVTVAACYTVGLFIVRWCGVVLKRQELFPLAFLAGASCVHLLMFSLFALKIAYKPVVIFVMAALIAAGIWKRIWRPRRDFFPALPRSLRVLFGVIFGAFTMLYFFHAWAPEMSPDGSGYHLGLLARYLREHGFERVTTNMYAALSAGIEMLFAPAFVVGRHSAAALVHFAMMVALALAMFAYGRRLGTPWAGAVGALLMYASPVVGLDGSSAYIDVGVAAIAFVLFYWLEIWDETRNPRLLVPIGLLAGYCFASKYTAFVMTIYALGFVLWRSRRLKPVLIVAAFVTLMIVPWLAKNWIYLQNPVSPFANQVFKNHWVHVSFEKDYSMMMARYEVKNKWTLPLEVTTSGEKTQGILGATFLAAPLALLALRYSSGRRLLLAGAMLGSLYLANVGTRFLIPCLPFFSMGMALALANVRPLLVLLAVFHAFASWPSGLRLYATKYVWALDKITYKQALRLIPQEKYLRENYGPYNLARMVEEFVPRGEVVYAVNSIPDAYTTREIAVSFQSARNEVIYDLILNAFVEDFQARHAFVFKFPRRQARKLRVVQTEPCDSQELWNVHEIRFYEGTNELPRLPEWRLSASVNPWDIQMAFDNSPVTRWRSWQTASPGMHLDVDFGAAKSVDQVRVETSRDHAKVQLRLETQDDSNRWIPLAENPEQIDVVPRGSTRRAVTSELRARGINYLLIADGDWGAQDMRDDPEGWGLDVVTTGWGMTIYKVAP